MPRPQSGEGIQRVLWGGQITLLRIRYRPTICVASLIVSWIWLQEITAAHGLNDNWRCSAWPPAGMTGRRFRYYAYHSSSRI